MIVFKAHKKSVNALAFSADGGMLASAGTDRLAVWSDSYKSPMFFQYDHCYQGANIAFSPDSRIVASASHQLRVWRLDMPSSAVLSEPWYLSQCCFSPDGAIFVAQGSNGLRRLDCSTWEALPGGWGGRGECPGKMQFPLPCITYHPDGSVVASVFGVPGSRAIDSMIYLWDAKTGEERAALRCPFENAHPEAIVFSPNGQTIAGIYGPHLRIWNIADRSQVAHRRVGSKHFKGLAFTPDGIRLVTVSNDETVRLWDTASWNEVGGFEWKIGKLGCVAVSPDGMRMAAGGSTGKVVIWDAD